MTIAQLKEAMDRIPATGVINLARRRAILTAIYALMGRQ